MWRWQRRLVAGHHEMMMLRRTVASFSSVPGLDVSTQDRTRVSSHRWTCPWVLERLCSARADLPRAVQVGRDLTL